MGCFLAYKPEIPEIFWGVGVRNAHFAYASNGPISQYDPVRGSGVHYLWSASEWVITPLATHLLGVTLVYTTSGQQVGGLYP